MTLKEFEARFPNDDACLEHMMRVRYGERHVCAKCGAEAHYYRVKKRRCYECEHCGYQVYPTAGTPFEKTKTSLKTWFWVMFMFCASRNGVSAKEVQRATGVTYKTAWRMCFEIRRYMGWVDGDSQLGGPGRPRVEVDKLFVGGKDKIGKDDKAIVLGMIERKGGEVLTRVIESRREFSVMPHVLQWVRPGASVATDEAYAFKWMNENGYRHETVNHSAKEYVRGDVHTNTLDAFWAVVRRGISGTYVWVSKKYLPVYLREFEYRHNLRRTPHVMFDLLLQAFPRPSARG